MKKKEWLKSLDGVDDKFVAQAAPTGAHRKARSGKTVRMLSIIAACMCFVLLAGTFALFIPYKSTPPSVAKYAGSEYYGIIEKLNEYNYDPPEYKNTFELLLDLPSNLFAKAEDWAPPMAPGEAENMTGMGNYQEVTDNQVSGVIEADLIKRSDTHIYYLSDDTLYIYSIEGEDSKLIGNPTDLRQYGMEPFIAEEFFLSMDCTKLTVISSGVDKTNRTWVQMTKVITLDVSDPANVQEISNVDVSGMYLSSRLTEHGLLIMTTMRCHDPDYDDERTYIPRIEHNGNAQSIPFDSIICPDKLSQASYTVMLLMDDVGTTVKDVAAYLSYSEDVYVSHNAIYATRRYTEYGQTQNGYTPYTTISEISCIGYSADGFDKRGSVIVDGYVLDQYSMDEYEGMLRVFTTTEGSSKQPNNWGLLPRYTSADLYVIDLATMQVRASVKQFAPNGETMKSARFEGNTAYACTAIQQTDPVFFFDLSDLSGITVKETGTIAGFSTSLVNFGDGFLLGIGQGERSDTLKLEVYVEGESGVESFTKLEMPYTNYYPDYKCYYIDRENGLIGMGIHTWDKISLDEYHAYKYENHRYGYVVFRFDGESISEVLRIEYGQGGDMREMRGVYIDGYYYVLNGDRLDVEKLELATE